MAYYAALVSVVQSLKEIIDRDQYSNFPLDKQQIASVYQKLSQLEILLEDYSPKDEEAADCLERQIRHAAYQVQDMLESQNIIKYRILLNLILPWLILIPPCLLIVTFLDAVLSCQPNPSLPYLVILILSFFPIYELTKAGTTRLLQDIEKAKEEVDSIVEQVTRMKIKKSHAAEELELTNYHSASQQKRTSCGDKMVGFEEQQTTIIDQLYGESSKLEVIPLVGMGGIGKTTLARSIFDDELIASRFDCRAWVTVSQTYHLPKLLQDFLGYMNVDTKNLREVELKEHIYKHLKWRRYLIIFDDIWATNVWDDMKMILPDDGNGSRIILTTRLSNVAVYANRCGYLHQMQFLDKDRSWNLLREKVFAQENCPQDLEVTGRLIAKNCHGLPLAIVVVAGLLSKVNKARYDWEGIARNVISATTKNDERFSKILSLSYNQLPHHLKPCFLYMGGFPEDYEISISKLIKLWVAEGFLKPGGSKSLEDKGEEYLEDLVKRNLVMITKKRSKGKFKSCSIHDVLRDLCLKRAHYESFLHFVDNDGNFYTEGTRNNFRRLYIHPGRSQSITELEFGSHVSSILCFRDKSRLLSFVSGFERLRTLDAREVRFYSFPIKVLKLSRLRYLALGRQSNSKFKIPPQISELENLQTLVVGPSLLYATCSVALAINEIWKWPHLRHVVIDKVELSSCIPFACILENLQTLSKVLNFKLTREAILMIPNLKKLKVFYSTEEPIGMWEKYCLYNLVRLCQLEKLGITFSSHCYRNSFPENFAFPQKLKELSLVRCQIPWKDMTVVGSLPNLQVLKLRNNAFVGDQWEPIEGEFPQLKFLLMDGLDLKYWLAEKDHFPRLEHLEIAWTSLKVGIPLEIGDIPTLELIKVHRCNIATYNSALQIEEEQNDLGNFILQVRTDRRQSGNCNWPMIFHYLVSSN